MHFTKPIKVPARAAAILALALALPVSAQSDTRAEAIPAQSTLVSDFMPIVGSGWSGTLEYLNFGREDRSTIPVRMVVGEPQETAIPYAFLYPGEEDENTSEVITLSQDGQMIDGKALVERRVAPDGAIILITQGVGSDDGEAVELRFTYELSASRFVVRKDVKRDDGTYFNRNEYRMTR